MNTGVIFNPKTDNLGDDIQTYAAMQFFDNCDILDRENLHSIKYPVKTIMNGWFMNTPQNWPPSKFINPLFLSFHGTESIINLNHYNYYKKYEPIGCRDIETLEHFNNIGIKAYFSGCLTLTLPKIKVEKNDEIIVVDLLRTNYNTKYRKEIVKRIIPEAYKNRVKYISHLSNNLESMTVEERIQNVKNTLQRYAQAKLVVTSLIHCALPCLALGTPVLFVDLGFSRRGNRRNRFGGILEQMNTWNNANIKFGGHSKLHKLVRLFNLHYLFLNSIKPIPQKLLENPIPNPSTYETYANDLRKKTELFVKR